MEFKGKAEREDTEPTEDPSQRKEDQESQGKDIKIVGICGSLRKDSLCKQALEVALGGCGDQFQVSLFDPNLLAELPFRDGMDFQSERYQTEFKPKIENFRNIVKEANGIIIGTPEYHNSFSGVLKNALDWLTAEELEGKIIGLICVSGATTGHCPIMHLRDSLRSLGVWIIPEQAIIPEAGDYFDDKGCKDEEMTKKLEQVGASTAMFTQLYCSSDEGEFLKKFEEAVEETNPAAVPPGSKAPVTKKHKSKVQDLTEKLFKFPLSLNKLIVIGGGFAGVKIAKKFRDYYQLLLVDSKDYWEYTPSLLRTIVQPERARINMVPFEQNVGSQFFFRGRVTQVNRDHLIVDRIYRIDFDLLIIATGSRYPSATQTTLLNRSFKKYKPEDVGGSVKDQNGNTVSREKSLFEEASRVKDAETICVVGGGPVGVELMAELVCKYPKKNYVLVHGHEKLLNNAPAASGAHNAAMKFFGDFQNLQILLEHRVTASTWKDGLWTLQTDKGQQIKADKVYSCAGCVPNTEFMRSTFSDSMDPKGFLLVSPQFLLKGTTNIYAVGDVVSPDSITDLKTAYSAEEHARHLCDNVKKIRKGKPFSGYKGQDFNPIAMVISLGPTRGIFCFMNKVVSTKHAAVTLKNKVEETIIAEYGQQRSLMNTSQLNKELKREVKAQRPTKKPKMLHPCKQHESKQTQEEDKEDREDREDREDSEEEDGNKEDLEKAKPLFDQFNVPKETPTV